LPEFIKAGWNSWLEEFLDRAGVLGYYRQKQGQTGV